MIRIVLPGTYTPVPKNHIGITKDSREIQPLTTIRLNIVIGINKHDVVASRYIQSVVTGVRKPTINLVDDLYPGISISIVITDLGAPIWATIIYEYNLYISQGLTQHAVHAAPQLILNFIDWNNYANKRHKQPPFISSLQTQRPS